jgi:hypothetical protein
VHASRAETYEAQLLLEVERHGCGCACVIGYRRGRADDIAWAAEIRLEPLCLSMRAAGGDGGSVWGVMVGDSETSPAAGGHRSLHVSWQALGNPRCRRDVSRCFLQGSCRPPAAPPPVHEAPREPLDGR